MVEAFLPKEMSELHCRSMVKKDQHREHNDSFSLSLDFRLFLGGAWCTAHKHLYCCGEAGIIGYIEPEQFFFFLKFSNENFKLGYINWR